MIQICEVTFIALGAVIFGALSGIAIIRVTGAAAVLAVATLINPVAPTIIGAAIGVWNWRHDFRICTLIAATGGIVAVSSWAISDTGAGQLLAMFGAVGAIALACTSENSDQENGRSRQRDPG